MILPDYFEPIWLTFVFVFGACIGSFLNVVLYRLPNGMSVAAPPSHCPHCQTNIAWYDNIPCLSYLLLRGKCRHCKTPYSSRYWFVEIFCGFIAMGIWFSVTSRIIPELIFEHTLIWFYWQAFVFALLTLSIIDFEYLIIPDEISLFLLFVGLAGLGLFPPEIASDRIFGALAGLGFLLFIAAVGFLIYRREAMGMGDVKLLGVIGLFLGWRVLPLILFLAAIQAIVIVFLVSAAKRIFKVESGFVRTTREVDEHFGELDKYESREEPERLAIPFGPFLALGAVEAFFIGDNLFWQLLDFALPGGGG